VLNIHLPKGNITAANIYRKMSHKVQYNVALKTKNCIQLKKIFFNKTAALYVLYTPKLRHKKL
jgi:hypothetical protein